MSSNTLPRRNNRYRGAALAALAASGILGFETIARAQTFNSGSSGADGAFDLAGTTSGTIVEFNPAVLRVNKDPNGPLLDPEHDNVFHFTTINVPTGVTVHFSSKYSKGPVYWLASGAVTIAGKLEMNGDSGTDYNRTIAARTPSNPGPGGFPGGVGGYTGTDLFGYPQAGFGPAGGLAWPNAPLCCFRGQGGRNSSTKFLVPLIGGSGGGGGGTDVYAYLGSGAGAGGGAILIASSVSVSLTGTIESRGGHSGYGSSNSGCPNYYGGGGAGGSIRIAAPIVQGGGTIETLYGYPNRGTCGDGNAIGSVGITRIEAFQHNWTFALNNTTYYTGSPVSTFVPTTPPPTLEVTAVNNQSVAPNPTGSFDLADVTINNSGPVDVVIHGHYVPLGTKPTLYLISLEGKDQIVDATTGLAGTIQDSTATISVTLPTGFSRGYVRAKWSAQ